MLTEDNQQTFNQDGVDYQIIIEDYQDTFNEGEADYQIIIEDDQDTFDEGEVDYQTISEDNQHTFNQDGVDHLIIIEEYQDIPKEGQRGLDYEMASEDRQHTFNGDELDYQTSNENHKDMLNQVADMMSDTKYGQRLPFNEQEPLSKIKKAKSKPKTKKNRKRINKSSHRRVKRSSEMQQDPLAGVTDTAVDQDQIEMTTEITSLELVSTEQEEPLPVTTSVDNLLEVSAAEVSGYSSLINSHDPHWDTFRAAAEKMETLSDSKAKEGGYPSWWNRYFQF